MNMRRRLDIMVRQHWSNSPDISSKGIGSFDCALSPVVPPASRITNDCTRHLDVSKIREIVGHRLRDRNFTGLATYTN